MVENMYHIVFQQKYEIVFESLNTYIATILRVFCPSSDPSKNEIISEFLYLL